jgi:Flp pilus assembly protein TadB
VVQCPGRQQHLRANDAAVCEGVVVVAVAMVTVEVAAVAVGVAVVAVVPVVAMGKRRGGNRRRSLAVLFFEVLSLRLKRSIIMLFRSRSPKLSITF